MFKIKFFTKGDTRPWHYCHRAAGAHPWGCSRSWMDPGGGVTKPVSVPWQWLGLGGAVRSLPTQLNLTLGPPSAVCALLTAQHCS